jgi:alginate O-acetyltransferase complex protein AlgI
VIFTDVRFVVLLVGCWLTFFAVPRAWRSLALVAWGVAFYAIYADSAVLLMLELVLAAYAIGRGRGDVVLTMLVVALLVRFRLGVDITGLSRALAAPSAREGVVLPLGFSFLAFELLHYVIECRSGRLQPASLVDVAAFALFFPCRIAGPIRRFSQFMSALADAVPTAENVYAGALRALTGLFKKLVIADVLALSAAEVSYAATPAHVWRVVLAFGVQIYVDFSAYSDMAIGASRMLGFAVPENFNWPYLSPSIQEFWNRWHMSLSAWARDYVFTPTGRRLFKTRLKASPTAIAALSYFATFIVIGAWHGLTPNFLVWGAYQGLLLTAYYVYRTWIPAGVARSAWFQSRLAGAASVTLTFMAVTIGWVPFMTDLPRSVTLLRLMFGGHP